MVRCCSISFSGTHDDVRSIVVIVHEPDPSSALVMYACWRATQDTLVVSSVATIRVSFKLIYQV